ncbi:hypothetical protein VP1G_00686 [Cytospora mali]|uniref:Monooxygenase n=1 Tax=Cytospora mali TaxID=578113 RepID=A0A194UP26_CYTMA|nr:hypothetical protein VP1G_00686 [Valsa mali var. pyri (nom. inval.)]
MIADTLKLPTILAIGALIQTATLALLPARYSLIPLALILARSIITTIIQSRSPKDNPFTTDTVYGRVTAQLPSRSTGDFGSQPAAQPLVVFHLGVRINHPLGLLAPGAREISDHFQAMAQDLRQRQDEFGMLSMSTWRAIERETNNSLLTIAYFRDVQDLNRFAHDKVHREGWDWYHSFAKKSGNTHIAVYHETFVTSPGQYETVYVDSAPTLLGAANLRVNVDGEKQEPGEETWTRPLVSADHSALRSQSRRMGMTLGIEGKTDLY